MNPNKVIDRIVKLEVIDKDNNLLERTKATSEDKNLGKIMAIRVKDLYGLTWTEIIEKEKRMIERFIKEELDFQVQSSSKL